MVTIYNTTLSATSQRHFSDSLGGGDAKRPHADRVSKHFDTKKEAMDWSRDLAKREGLELIPHGTDGKIQHPNSYGSDQCPPKDTKN